MIINEYNASIADLMYGISILPLAFAAASTAPTNSLFPAANKRQVRHRPRPQEDAVPSTCVRSAPSIEAEVRIQRVQGRRIGQRRRSLRGSCVCK